MNGTVVERTGMAAEPAPDGNGTVVSWDGEAEAPSFTYHADADGSGDGWAFARIDHVVRYRDADGDWHATDEQPFHPDPENGIELRERTAGSGYVGSELQYLGEYEETSVTRGNHTITTIVPAAASPDARSNAVLELLAGADDRLTVGARDRQVNVFVWPSRDFAMTLDEEHGVQDVWLSDDESLQRDVGVENAWLHEYVHTRQRFADLVDDRLEWLVEGSATYYDALLAYNLGYVSFDEFQDDVDSDTGADVVLSNKSAKRFPVAQYSKGARVLAALDAKIRRATGGDRTLQAVLRRLNAHVGGVDEPTENLTYAEFKDIVAEVAGQRFDDWLDRYVTTSEVPFVPENPDLFAMPGTARPGDPERSTATPTDRPPPPESPTASSTSATSPTGSEPSTPSATPTAKGSTTGPEGTTAADSPGLGALPAMGALFVLAVAALGRRRTGR